MNIQDYISSGIIETYALGLAGEEEARELERLCLEHPEVKAALVEAQQSLESYAQLHAVDPPAEAKDQIWDALSGAETSVQTETTEPVIEKGISKMYLYWAIAACLLLALVLPYHIYKVNQYQAEIAALKKEKAKILALSKTFQAQVQQVNEQLDILTNPAVRSILLAGTPNHTQEKAFVYWKQSGEVFLSSGTLPSLPDDKQYQLWAIVDGKPVSAGLLEHAKTTALQKMITIEHAQMFAVTIEKRGGSKQPTLEQMIVAGKTL